MITCRKCGEKSPDNAHYCAKCGAPLEYSMYGTPKNYLVVAKEYIEKCSSIELEKDKLEENVADLKRKLELSKNENFKLSSDKAKLAEDNLISQAKIFASRSAQISRLEAENISLKKQLETPWLVRKLKAWDWGTIGEWGFWLLVIGVICGAVVYFSERPSKPPIEIVEENSKYGIYDNVNDKQLVACRYDSIVYQKNAGCYYFLYKNGKVGLADSAVVTLVEPQFDSLRICSNNSLVISYKDGKQGLFDGKCQEILTCGNYRVLWDEIPKHGWNDDEPGQYVGNIIPVKYNENSNWFLYDRSRKRISNTTSYSRCTQTGVRNLIKVCDRKYSWKMGLIDDKGNVILPLEYARINTFSCNRAWVQKESGKNYTCINEKGERCFDSNNTNFVYMFSEGLAAIEKNEKVGFIDTLGNIVIPFDYSIAYNKDRTLFKFPIFYKGKAIVSNGKQTGRIDKNGVFAPDNTIFDN